MSTRTYVYMSACTCALSRSIHAYTHYVGEDGGWDNNAAELINEMRNQIQSRDASWRLQEEKPSSSSASLSTSECSSLRGREQERKTSAERLREILRDLTDALLPVRAHAIVELRRMVKEKDELAFKNYNRVAEVFLRAVGR